MDQLIKDLLRLSHLGRQKLIVMPVDVSKLVKSVVDELMQEAQGRSVEIKLEDVPDCLGDASLLKQVFINLFSNALKFTSHKDVAVIELGCQRQKDQLAYFLRDNGAGFDMDYSDKLFGVFQRLHSTAEFEGSGIGLSIVKRIIERHGGRVWADGAVGQGATFYFTLVKSGVDEDGGQAEDR